MSNNVESETFGFDRSKTQTYSIDTYSTPDDWHDMGYELQYTFEVYFHESVKEEDRVKFLDTLLGVFKSNFALASDAHYQLGVPTIRLTGHLVKVFWDKGRLDLRILQRLEDEINSVAIQNQATVKLIMLIIIPRSQETIASKVEGKL